MRITSLVLLSAALAWFGASGAPAATERPAPKVGFINLYDIQEKAIPVRQQIDAASQQIKDMQAQLDEKTKRLVELRSQARNTSVLSKEEQDKIPAEANKLQDEIDDLELKINYELKKSGDKAINAALDLIINAIDAVAKREGYSLIIKSEAVVYGDPSCEITKQVIDYLNSESGGGKASAEGKAAPAPAPAKSK
ncbi:MAG: OmpH family outer membrane protein [Candidatus Sumerlaeota bacterium]|nr:OmpH family outer membrane protein [Candidatus Sumerlaeota bacterium]